MARQSLDMIYKQTTSRPSLDSLFNSNQFPTGEPEEVRKGFFDRITSAGFFQASAEDSPVMAAVKTVGNVIPSALGFARAIPKFLDPRDKLRDINEVEFAIKGTTKDVGAMAEGEAGLSFQTNQLLATIRKNRAEGKDVTRLLQQLKINGINVPSDLQEIQPARLSKEIAKGPLPLFFKQLAEGDTVGMQKTIIEDPSGTLLPVLLVMKESVRGTALEKPFNTAIEKTASVVTKPVKTVITKTQNVAATMTRFGTAQATGLNPKTIDTILKNPKEFTTENAANYTRENIAHEVNKGITDRVTELRSTGKGYEIIRQSPGSVILPENITANVLKKYGLELDPNGNIKSTAESVPLKAGDLAALESFYKQYGKEQVLSNNGFLNARRALDQLSEWDATKSDVSNRIAKELRIEYDALGKDQIAKLTELDAKYAPEVELLNRVKRDYMNPDGTFKDNALTKIANLTNQGREQILGRLEKIRPGVTKEIDIIKALEDIEHASGQKVGTYGRAALSGGGLLGGILTSNPFLIVGSIVEAVLSQPNNAAAIIRGYARLRGVTDNVSAPIINTLKNINEFNVKGVVDKTKNLNIGATVKDVSTLPAERFFGKNADIKSLQANVDNAGVLKYMEKIKAGERPVVSIETNPKTGQTVVTDGNTTLEAYKRLQTKEIPVRDTTSAPIPTENSLEGIGEKGGGWPEGLKAKFDNAMMHKDAATLSKLLPQVPEAYKKLFKKTIEDVLGGD